MSAQKQEPIPYVGPRPFEEHEREFFFGRRLEVNDLISLVTAYQVVLLYAQSGAGKTSLLKASLIPRLQTEEKFYVLPVARVRSQGPVVTAPGEIRNIFVFNALSALAEGNIPRAELARMTIVQFIEWHRKSLGPQEHAARWLLIFDQFEELFTHHLDRWKDRQDLFSQVSEALKADTQLRVIFSMREDFIAELDPYAQLIPGKLRTRFRMERLRRANALEAIQEPLNAPAVKALGRKFDEGVAEALVDDLLKIRVKSDNLEWEIAGQFVEPVQLQIVCQALWEELKPENSLITFEHLKAIGSVNDALTRFYEKAVKEAAAAGGVSEASVRRWFDRTMITPEGNRNTVLLGKDETGGMPNAVVAVLEAKRLLRSEQRDGRFWYELGQDRFIKPIQESYKKWLAEQPGDEQTRLQLENQAAKWIDSKRRDKSLLLDQGQLLVAKRWVETEAGAGSGNDALYSLIEASDAEIIKAERERERELTEANRLRIEAERAHAKEQQRLAEERAAAQQRDAEQATVLAAEQRRLAESERQRAEEKVRLSRRLSYLLATVSALFVLSVVAAGFAIRQTRVASAQQRLAETESVRANEQFVIATKSAEDARAAREEERASRVDAERNARAAREAADKAEAESRRANEQTQLARRETARANEQAALAMSETKRANLQAELARKETERANREALQAKTARDKEALARAEAEMRANEAEAATKRAIEAEGEANKQSLLAKKRATDLEKALNDLTAAKNSDQLNREAQQLEAKGDLGGALRNYREVLKIYERSNDTKGQMQTLVNISQVTDRMYDYKETLRNQQQALGLASTLRERADVLLAIGFTQINLKERQAAVQSFKSAEEIYDKELDYTRGESQAHYGMGYAYLGLSDIKSAIKAFRDAEEEGRQANDPYLIASALRGQGETRVAEGKLVDAIEFFQAALTVYQKIGDKEMQGIVLHGIAEIYRSKGNEKLALQYLKRAQDLASSNSPVQQPTSRK